MKNALKVAAFLSAGPCIAYLWFAFIVWDFHAGNWGEGDRLAVAFLALIFASFGGAFAQFYLDQPRNRQ